MSFERFYHEIREKLGNEAQDLYNKDLLKKIHSHTLDCKWNFDKGQEISEGNFGAFNFPKKQRIKFPNFCPSI
jgi:hypothetical protein